MSLSYLDNAANEPLHPEVRRAVADAILELGETGGNPASSHTAGRRCAAMLANARARVATVIGADPAEVIFTGGGTESIALGIRGIAQGVKDQNPLRNRIITSAVEHDAVTEAIKSLPEMLMEEIPVDSQGVVQVQQLLSTVESGLEEALKLTAPDHNPKNTCGNKAKLQVENEKEAETSIVSLKAGRKSKPVKPDEAGLPALVAVMAVGNENGVIQPVCQIVSELEERYGSRKVPVFTDAIQALGKIPVDFDAWGVDAMSITGHKIGGPVSAGALIMKRDVPYRFERKGGGQERTVRGGTPDILGAIGLATAMEVAETNREENNKKYRLYRESLLAGLAHIPGVKLATQAQTTPGIIQLLLDGCEAEALLMALDQAEVCVSAGSACHTGVSRPSKVLLAQGLDEETALGVIRISMGWQTTQREIDHFLEALPAAIEVSRRFNLRRKGRN